jgi:uncharacterized protein
MPNTNAPSTEGSKIGPNFLGLVRFLLQPFLDEPESLAVDCEQLESTQKIWIRVAFSGTDKGKVFGRGGRNLQAIRTVLAATASLVGKSLHFEVYGSHEARPDFDPELGERPRNRERNHEDDRPRRDFGVREDDRDERRPVRRNNDSRPQKKELF